jgi:hypothetical protein
MLHFLVHYSQSLVQLTVKRLLIGEKKSDFKLNLTAVHELLCGFAGKGRVFIRLMNRLMILTTFWNSVRLILLQMVLIIIVNCNKTCIAGGEI